MKTRILTASVLLAVVAAGFLLEWLRWAPVLLVLALAVGAVVELAAMGRRKGVEISRPVAGTAVAVLVLLGWWGRPDLGLEVLALAMLAAFVPRVLFGGRVENVWRDVAGTVGAALYVGVPLAFAVLLFVQSDATRAVLLFVLAAIWLTDSAALFVGKRFGQIPLSPNVSPNKTVEGAFGGVLGALIPAVVVRVLDLETFRGFHDIELLLFCVAISVVGQVGDLAESALKRDAGVKDSGNLLPGHGGALDRIDSILATMVPVVLYLKLAHPGVLQGIGGS